MSKYATLPKMQRGRQFAWLTRLCFGGRVMPIKGVVLEDGAVYHYRGESRTPRAPRPVRFSDLLYSWFKQDRLPLGGMVAGGRVRFTDRDLRYEQAQEARIIAHRTRLLPLMDGME